MGNFWLDDLEDSTECTVKNMDCPVQVNFSQRHKIGIPRQPSGLSWRILNEPGIIVVDEKRGSRLHCNSWCQPLSRTHFVNRNTGVDRDRQRVQHQGTANFRRILPTLARVRQAGGVQPGVVHDQLVY
jgi:hypothetical protein